VIHGNNTWRLHDGKRQHSVSAHGRLESDCGEATLRATLAGVDIAMLSTFLASEHMGRGELVVLLTQYRIPSSACTWCDHGPPRVHRARPAR
jgi:DNA-binding transcriptional LysR family regulator